MRARALIRVLKKYNIGPYIEVPCSILAPLIAELLKDKQCRVINPANEAVAMGFAVGSYLATQKIPALLIQNSGFCNTINALTSLNHPYKIPFLYIISWRGEPKTNDAPEHHIMGMKLKELLRNLGIPYIILSKRKYKEQIYKVIEKIRKTLRPAALILKKGIIEEQKLAYLRVPYAANKSRIIDIILDATFKRAYFVCTNGYISREVFYNLNKRGIDKLTPVFYMLGSMGHALPIALGFSSYRTFKKKIIVLDGDGGCLMHMGALPSVGKDKPNRLLHFVLDNGTYASTGGQPTVSRNIDFCLIAKGCGYRNIYRFKNEDKLKNSLPNLLFNPGPTFVHILINSSEGKERPRVSDKYSCVQIKDRFIRLSKKQIG